VFLVVILAGVGAAAVVQSAGNSTDRRDPGPRVPTVADSPQPTPTPTLSATASGSPVPSASPAAPAALTYLRGTRLVTRSLGSDVEQTVMDLHTADVSASSTSSWLAYVAPKKGTFPGNGDFVPRPELHFLDLASGADLDVGSGFDPLWKGDGSEVAYLAPSRARNCDAENCAGTVRVMVAAPDAPPRQLTAFGRLHLLAWAGDRLLVSDDADLRHTMSVASDGSGTSALPVPPSKIWDASPDGQTLLTVVPGHVSFMHLVGGRPTRTATSYDLAGEILGDGSWSTDPNRAAGVVRKRDGSSVLAFLSPQHGVVPVRGSAGAMGNVVWDSGAARFAFVAEDKSHRNRLRTVVCRMVTDLRASCRPWFSWSQGVALLKLSSS
jgi:hypothetical protein